MRQGFRVFDSDTHVNPSMDVLLRYADAPLRERMDDLAPYLRKVKVSPGRGDDEDQGQATILSIKQLRYSRVAGAKPSAPTGPEGERGFLSARTHMVTRQPITVRVADDNARGRLADMDTEGRDIDFIIPGPWAYGAPALAPHLTRGLVDAYHRYMAEYCAADPRRLKSMVLAPATDPAASARDRRAREGRLGGGRVAAAPRGVAGRRSRPGADLGGGERGGPADHVSRGGQRFLSFMLMGGMLDRYPRLRVGTLECGHGWLPHWLVRLTRQIDYVRGSVSPTLQHTPVEYTQMGR
jgi:predicted TIM-barrel fold metal-dependent hydrolase